MPNSITMVERVARALCRFDGNPENATFDGRPLWNSYSDQARSIITAMRDPPIAFLEAFRRDEDMTLHHSCALWERMITAALEDE